VGHHPGAQVAGLGGRVIGDQPGQRRGVAVQDLPLAGHQRRAGRDHLGHRDEVPDQALVRGGEETAGLQHKPAERRHDRLSRRPVPHRGQQLVLEGLHAPVDEVLLGREVVEHGGLGHLGRPGYRGHRDRVEAALGEQLHGRLRDQLPGTELLALPQPQFSIHGRTLP
jgi:hypothetical protein